MPWYNCLAWAFDQVLGKTLPCTHPRKYVLNYNKAIDIAFIEKACEFGINLKKISTLEEREQYQYGFLLFGYYLEEIQCNGYKDYRESGFHVVLYNGTRLFHQNGCGFIPTSTTMKELQNSGYINPVYFAVI